MIKVKQPSGLEKKGTSSWSRTSRKKEEGLIQFQTDQDDGQHDKDSFIYKGLIMTVLEYKDEESLEAKYHKDQAIAQ